MSDIKSFLEKKYGSDIVLAWEDDKTIALQMIRKFGTIAAVNEAIVSLSQFLIYNRKVA